MVSLADSAAGGGTTPSLGDRGIVPPTSSAGSSSRTGERGKRGSGGGSTARAKLTTPASGNGNNGKKKKEGPCGPLLYDGSSESWGGLQVRHGSHVMVMYLSHVYYSDNIIDDFE